MAHPPESLAGERVPTLDRVGHGPCPTQVRTELRAAAPRSRVRSSTGRSVAAPASSRCRLPVHAGRRASPCVPRRLAVVLVLVARDPRRAVRVPRPGPAGRRRRRRRRSAVTATTAPCSRWRWRRPSSRRRRCGRAARTSSCRSSPPTSATTSTPAPRCAPPADAGRSAEPGRPGHAGRCCAASDPTRSRSSPRGTRPGSTACSTSGASSSPPASQNGGLQFQGAEVIADRSRSRASGCSASRRSAAHQASACGRATTGTIELPVGDADPPVGRGGGRSGPPSAPGASSRRRTRSRSTASRSPSPPSRSARPSSPRPRVTSSCSASTPPCSATALGAGDHAVRRRPGRRHVDRRRHLRLRRSRHARPDASTSRRSATRSCRAARRSPTTTTQTPAALTTEAATSAEHHREGLGVHDQLPAGSAAGAEHPSGVPTS